MTVANQAQELLGKLGVDASTLKGGGLKARTPVTGEQIAALTAIDADAAKAAIDRADEAFRAWRLVPAPRRGELVRLLGEELRACLLYTSPSPRDS